MENSKNTPDENKPAIGFKFAWNGIVHFFRSQLNARIHAAIAVIVLVAGMFAKLSTTEWIIIAICIGMVFTAEMLNTAIELLTDLVSPRYNKKAGQVKDMAAGAVLVSAIAAAAAGLWIFLPRIYVLICTWTGIC